MDGFQSIHDPWICQGKTQIEAAEGNYHESEYSSRLEGCFTLFGMFACFEYSLIFVQSAKFEAITQVMTNQARDSHRSLLIYQHNYSSFDSRSENVLLHQNLYVNTSVVEDPLEPDIH